MLDESQKEHVQIIDYMIADEMEKAFLLFNALAEHR